MVDLAKVAYDAYCESTGGVSLISGAKLPPFHELKDEIKRAWDAAAQAVAKQLTGHEYDGDDDA